MEIVLEPPREVLGVLLVPVVITVALALAIKLFNKQVSWPGRIVPVAIASVMAGAVLWTAFQRRTFAFGEQGIVDDTFGGPIHIAWSDVEEARRVRDVWRSEFGLAMRTNGMAYGRVRAGEFRLRNGQSAHVFMLTNVDEAFVIRSKGALYVYAPEPFEAFALAVAGHVQGAQ